MHASATGTKPDLLVDVPQRQNHVGLVSSCVAALFGWCGRGSCHTGTHYHFAPRREGRCAESLRGRSNAGKRARRHLSRPECDQLTIRPRRGTCRHSREHRAFARACCTCRRHVGKQLTLYPVVHRKGENDEAFENALNVSTQNAAHEILTEPRYGSKTVVMVWEHKHIANKKLERAFSEEKVTLRQLLNLDQLEGVPKTWPSGTYDYFWIVEYGNQGSDVPTRFSMVKQEFGPPYGALPANDWDQPNGLEPESGCDLKGAQD